jgi:hypothetical protein
MEQMTIPFTSHLRICRHQRGQATLAAGLSLLMLALLAAGVVDVARLWETRLWAYRVAEAAALTGASAGRDYAAFVATGVLTLEATAAQTAAQDALLLGLRERGLDSTAAYDIRVHPVAGPASFPGYPPVVRASQRRLPWSPDAPAVGVYLVIPVRPILCGWINGNAPIDLHVFAAAGVAL